jgi:hypothetical protein
MELTRENYFSTEMSRKYCGSTQFKEFLDCPARAMAIIEGRWKEPKTLPFLIGGYVDAFFEGTLEQYKKENPEIFNRNGSLKAPFLHADKIIKRVLQDELFTKYMSGEKQVIKTGEIAGVPVKIRIDSYHAGKVIVDLKIVAGLNPVYNAEKGCEEDFIHHWGYDYQAAFYQSAEGNNLPFVIAAATKEDEPDLALIRVPQAWIDEARNTIENEIGIIAAIKRGEIEARRCEKCAYCRRSKKLTRVISAEELLESKEETMQ